jgi:hypothetical protein
MRFFPWNNTDPDAAAYIAAVVAAGGTVTATQSSAINTFIREGKTAGWWASLRRIQLPIWGVAAPNAICMKSLTSGTFVGGITHGAGFFTTDGSTGYFMQGSSLAAQGATTSSLSFFSLQTAASAIAGSVHICGVQDSNNNSRVTFTGGGANIRRPRSMNALGLDYAETDSRGILLSSRVASATMSAYRRTSGGSTVTIDELASVGSAVPTSNNLAFGANNNNGVIGSFTPSTVRFGAVGTGLGMVRATAEAFTLSLKNLYETSTGIALP